MNWKNEFDLEPGTYADEKGSTLVVVDVVNHIYNVDKGLPEAVADPYVITRPIESKGHVRTWYPMSIFKTKFSKV